MSNKEQKDSASRIERRRQLTAGAFHIGSALVRTYGESDPDVSKISFHAVRLARAILNEIDRTEQE